jgi:hypothetical protein
MSRSLYYVKMCLSSLASALGQPAFQSQRPEKREVTGTPHLHQHSACFCLWRNVVVWCQTGSSSCCPVLSALGPAEEKRGEGWFGGMTASLRVLITHYWSLHKRGLEWWSGGDNPSLRRDCLLLWSLVCDESGCVWGHVCQWAGPSPAVHTGVCSTVYTSNPKLPESSDSEQLFLWLHCFLRTADFDFSFVHVSFKSISFVLCLIVNSKWQEKR